jgi:hypothetical protein
VESHAIEVAASSRDATPACQVRAGGRLQLTLSGVTATSD